MQRQTCSWASVHAAIFPSLQWDTHRKQQIRKDIALFHTQKKVRKKTTLLRLPRGPKGHANTCIYCAYVSKHDHYEWHSEREEEYIEQVGRDGAGISIFMTQGEQRAILKRSRDAKAWPQGLASTQRHGTAWKSKRDSQESLRDEASKIKKEDFVGVCRASPSYAFASIFLIRIRKNIKIQKKTSRWFLHKRLQGNCAESKHRISGSKHSMTQSSKTGRCNDERMEGLRIRGLGNVRSGRRSVTQILVKKQGIKVPCM